MRAVSPKRARENRRRAKLLAERRGPGPTYCEARLEGCQGWVTDGHEVRTSGRGGSRVDMSNVVDLCRHCHQVITDNSGQEGWAIRHGWVVASWADRLHEDEAWHVRTTFRCPLSCEVDHRVGFA